MKQWQKDTNNVRVKDGKNYLIYSAELVRRVGQPEISLLIAYNQKDTGIIKWIHRIGCVSIGLNTGKITFKCYATDATAKKEQKRKKHTRSDMVRY